jgi:hypothetical protein
MKMADAEYRKVQVWVDEGDPQRRADFDVGFAAGLGKGNPEK